jgi:hypothetical protein
MLSRTASVRRCASSSALAERLRTVTSRWLWRKPIRSPSTSRGAATVHDSVLLGNQQPGDSSRAPTSALTVASRHYESSPCTTFDDTWSGPQRGRSRPYPKCARSAGNSVVLRTSRCGDNCTPNVERAQWPGQVRPATIVRGRCRDCSLSCRIKRRHDAATEAVYLLLGYRTPLTGAPRMALRGPPGREMAS